MNKKISLGLALALIFVAIAGTIAATMAVSMNMYNSLIKDLPNRSQTYSSLSELDEIIRANYYGEINENLLNSDMSEGYVDGLGDAYSYYMTATEYDAYKNEMDGQKLGIGVITAFNENDMCLYVAEVSENSPAALSNMSKGDKIVSIDDEEVTVYNHTELEEKLNGDKLTAVTVAFMHEDTLVTESIVKGYTAQTVFYEINGSVGYLKITDFYSTTADQLKTAANALIKQGVSGIVVDLRGVSNGTIEYAAKALDVIVPVASEGTKAIATAIGKDGSTTQTFTADADSITVSMMVLADTKTSGAAELFACDLRDFGKAKIIGEQTKGNGTMQKAYQLSNGGAVMLTTAEIQPYISEIYNRVGLTPDYEIKLSAEKQNGLALLSLQDDDQYQKAYSLLTGVNSADTQE